MRTFWLLWLVTIVGCTSAVPAGKEDGWIPLFDGRTLEGWEPRGGGIFSVDQGTILGVTGTGAYGWLCSRKSYGDFVLECEARVEGPGNSGVQVRSHIDAQDLMTGYQFDLDRTRPSTGRLYDEARRKLLEDVPLRPEARQALKPEEWNHLRMECIGDRLRSWVNGVAIVDYLDPVDLEGILALQVHSGKDTRVRWRNFRLKDLGRRHWEPIWNGTGLEGWNPIGEAEWKVQEGRLSGRLSKRGYAALSTVARYPEFTLRVVFRRVQGKASLCFGTPLPDGDAGSRVALTGGKAQDWNELVVSVHEGRAAMHLNGDRLADLRAPAAGGPIAIEMVGEGSQVDLKSIEILGAARRE